MPHRSKHGSVHEQWRLPAQFKTKSTEGNAAKNANADGTEESGSVAEPISPGDRRQLRQGQKNQAAPDDRSN